MPVILAEYGDIIRSVQNIPAEIFTDVNLRVVLAWENLNSAMYVLFLGIVVYGISNPLAIDLSASIFHLCTSTN